jgi:hypothetical protein
VAPVVQFVADIPKMFDRDDVTDQGEQPSQAFGPARKFGFVVPEM